MSALDIEVNCHPGTQKNFERVLFEKKKTEHASGWKIVQIVVDVHCHGDVPFLKIEDD